MDSPAVARGENKVFPFRMLANQQCGIGGVGAPAHGFVEDWTICKPGQECRDGFAHRDVGGVRVRVGGVFGVGSWHRYTLRRARAKGLMLLEARETGKLVTVFDDAVPAPISIFESGAAGRTRFERLTRWAQRKTQCRYCIRPASLGTLWLRLCSVAYAHRPMPEHWSVAVSVF